MPRINVEESVWSDARYFDLSAALGCRFKAMGILVAAWKLAQDFWRSDAKKKKPGRLPIPADRWAAIRFPEALFECGWAERRENGDVYMKGSEEAFKWLEEKANNGRKGGSSEGKRTEAIVERTEAIASFRLANGSERKRTEASSSSSSSSSSSNSNKIPNTNTFPTNPIETEIPSAAVAASECNELIVKESHKVTRKKSPKEPAPTTAAFDAYSEAIKKRYGVEPARGAAVNGQLASMLRSVPADELPDLLVWYVSRCNDSSAIRARHAIRDATWRIQTLFMDWQAGSTITQAQANNMDKTSTNFNSLQLVLDRMEKKGAK